VKGLTQRQQWDALVIIAHGLKLPCGQTGNWNLPYYIGKKYYPSITSATCALLSALAKAKVEIPEAIKARPIDLR